jgi:hypothetical protein
VNRRALRLGLAAVGASAGCKECEKHLPPGPSTTVDASEPPRLVDATFRDPSVVELVFTEPLAPVDGVDPEKFRLSAAKGDAESYRYRGRRFCYKSTYYYDLSDAIGDFGGCDPSYEVCSPATRVIELALDDDDARRLRLTIDPPLGGYQCLQIDYAGDDAGIFVHFAAAGIPTIEDESGQALEDIAPHWVLAGARYTYREGVFPAMDVFLPIPCP